LPLFAFFINRIQGNPVAVVFEADGLSSAQMQVKGAAARSQHELFA